MSADNTPSPQIVSREEWLAARQQLLASEKGLTRQYDAVAAARRALPWVKIEKQYVFDSTRGRVRLTDLFQNRSQLIVRHFMFGPGWKEGCVGCSFSADHVDGSLVHLEHHDVSFVAVSRAPIAEIEPFQSRMGWRFLWVSSYNSDFNFDFHVSFTPEQAVSGKVHYNDQTQDFLSEERSGVSVFCKDSGGNVFHTYSTFGRGDELLVGTYMHLDLTPKGRNETARGNLTDWVRHHDRYDAQGSVNPEGRYVAAKPETSGCCSEYRG